MTEQQVNPECAFPVLLEWVRLSLAPAATLDQIREGELVRRVYNAASGENIPNDSVLCDHLGVEPLCPGRASEAMKTQKRLEMWTATLSSIVTEFDKDERYSSEIQALADDKQLVLMDLVEPFLEKEPPVGSTPNARAYSSSDENLAAPMSVSVSLANFQSGGSSSSTAPPHLAKNVPDTSVGGGRGSSSSLSRRSPSPAARSSPTRLNNTNLGTTTTNTSGGNISARDSGPGGTTAIGAGLASSSATLLDHHHHEEDARGRESDLKQRVSMPRTSTPATVQQHEEQALIAQLQAEVARLKKDTAGRAAELLDAEFAASAERHELDRQLRDARERLKAAEDRYAKLEQLHAAQSEKLLHADAAKSMEENVAATRAKLERMAGRVAELTTERDTLLSEKKRADTAQKDLRSAQGELQRLQENMRIKDALREKSLKTEGVVEELQQAVQRWQLKAQEASDSAEQLRVLHEEANNAARMLQAAKEEELFAAEERRREALQEQRTRHELETHAAEEKLQQEKRELGEREEVLRQAHARETEALRDHLEKKDVLLQERKQALLDNDTQYKEDVKQLEAKHAHSTEQLRQTLERERKDSESRLRRELLAQETASVERLSREHTEALAKERERYEDVCREHDSVRAELRETRLQHSREIDDLRQHGDSTERDLVRNWSTKLDDATTQLDLERQRTVELEAELKQKWEQECATLRQQHEQLLASQLAQVESAWADKERAYKTEAADMLARAEQEFQKLQADCASLRKEAKDARDEAERASKEASAEKDALALKNQKETQSLSEHLRGKAEEVLNDLKQRHQRELESQKRQLEGELANRHKLEIDKLRKIEHDLRAQQESDVAELVTTIQTLRNEIAEKEQRILKAEKEQREALEAIEQKQSESSNTAFATLRDKCDQLKGALKAAKDEQSQSQLQLDEVRLKLHCVLESSKKERDEARREIEMLKKRLASAEERVLQTEARLRLEREQGAAAKGSISSMKVLETLRGRQLADLEQNGINWQEKYRTLMESYKEISTAYEQDRKEREQHQRTVAISGMHASASSSASGGGEQPNSGSSSSLNGASSTNKNGKASGNFAQSLLEENIALKKEKRDMIVRHAAALRQLAAASSSQQHNGGKEKDANMTGNSSGMVASPAASSNISSLSSEERRRRKRDVPMQDASATSASALLFPGGAASDKSKGDATGEKLKSTLGSSHGAQQSHQPRSGIMKNTTAQAKPSTNRGDSSGHGTGDENNKENVAYTVPPASSPGPPGSGSYTENNKATSGRASLVAGSRPPSKLGSPQRQGRDDDMDRDGGPGALYNNPTASPSVGATGEGPGDDGRGRPRNMLVLEEKQSGQPSPGGYPSRGMGVKRELLKHERTDSAEKRVRMTQPADDDRCRQQ
ncbi:unnamed protein product [Amoebophrya sp. A25]|nr:unnamed protein product [Amoebophrya sp. A25]|eukprot:GSA25T00021541001.1